MDDSHEIGKRSGRNQGLRQTEKQGPSSCYITNRYYIATVISRLDYMFNYGQVGRLVCGNLNVIRSGIVESTSHVTHDIRIHIINIGDSNCSYSVTRIHITQFSPLREMATLLIIRNWYWVLKLFWSNYLTCTT